MLELVLRLALTVAGTWTWDEAPGAVGYEFCWSYDVERFSRALCTDVGSSPAFLPSVELENDVLVVTPGQVLYIQICAYNYNGDGSKNYDADCAGFAPVPPDWGCP